MEDNCSLDDNEEVIIKKGTYPVSIVSKELVVFVELR